MNYSKIRKEQLKGFGFIKKKIHVIEMANILI